MILCWWAIGSTWYRRTRRQQRNCGFEKTLLQFYTGTYSRIEDGGSAGTLFELSEFVPALLK